MNILTKRIIALSIVTPFAVMAIYEKNKVEIDMFFDTSPEWAAYNECIEFVDSPLGGMLIERLTPEQAKEGCLDSYKAKKKAAALKEAEEQQ